MKVECVDCKTIFEMDKKTQGIYFDMMADSVTIECPCCGKSKTYRRFQEPKREWETIKMDEFDVSCDQQNGNGLYDVPAHEVLISFNNDNDAAAFIEWFQLKRDDFETFFHEQFDVI
jgi:hypothetical protein